MHPGFGPERREEAAPGTVRSAAAERSLHSAPLHGRRRARRYARRDTARWTDTVAGRAARSDRFAPERRERRCRRVSHACRFSELRPLISGIQSHLAELDVQPGDCVVLELANAVPSALLALSCLDAGLSVMLVPMAGPRCAGRRQQLRGATVLPLHCNGAGRAPARPTASRRPRELYRRAPQPELRPRERCGSRARPTATCARRAASAYRSSWPGPSRAS